MGTTLIGEAPRPERAKGTTLVGAPSGGTRLAAPVTETGIGTGAGAERAGLGPVVGWLVVVDGPGTGRSVPLGYGMNIVGRGAHNRVVLDFGDQQISEEDHFRIAYDRKNRRFHLVPGRGTNLVYLEGAPLLTPVELTGHRDIRVGSSVIRFVPFCTSDWDWPDRDGA
ncbi:MAG: hypothetical protein JWO81_104 [Alphaproteobacteria bacterium]|nr:hypothetical protein [Alphaproteobacteria bacterium]